MNFGNRLSVTRNAPPPVLRRITMVETDVKGLEEESYALLFAVRRSVRYHMRRACFFDLLHSSTNAIGVIAGSAAVMTVISNYKEVAVGAAILVTIMSALDLVVGTARMARLHNDLAKDFIRLEREIVLVELASEQQLRVFSARRLEIEVEEPPVMRTLDRLCHNEQLRAEGFASDKMVFVPLHHRILAQFISFEPARADASLVSS